MEMANDAALNPQELASMARARAAFYSFLNVHFTTLMDVPFVKRLRNGELTTVLKVLVNDESVDADLATGASLMLGYLDKTHGEDAAQIAENLGVDRTRLYRGVSPQYGPPPPLEMVWSKTGQDFSVLQTIAGFYHDMGLAQSPDVKERLDYIGVEMDFIRELALHEAAAWDSSALDNAAELLKAQQAFMSQHLGQWVPAFIEKALEYVETDFYKGHLFMLRGFIASEQQELASLVKEIQA